MAKDKQEQTSPPARKDRDDRLKSALKKNLARRKAQARARAAGEDGAKPDQDK